MKIYLKVIVSFCCIGLLSACSVSKEPLESLSETAQLERQFSEIKILGIKGSGSFPDYGYKKYDGNTTGSVKNALKKLDGAVIDIQLNKDSNFWVYGESEVLDCDRALKKIIDMNDDNVKYVSHCWHDSKLISLDRMLYELTYSLNKEKILVLNLQFLDDAKAIELIGGKRGVVDSVLKKLDWYFAEFEVNVMLEIANDTLYPLFKKKSKYKVYHTQVDKENIGKKGDFIFPFGVINDVNAKEIKSRDFQITEVNTIEDMLVAMKTDVKYIQTQNVGLGEYFMRVDTNSKVDTVLYQAPILEMSSGEEKQLLAKFNIDDWGSSFLLSFKVESISEEGGAFIEYIGENKGGNELFWESRGIATNTFYRKLINAEELKERGVEEFSLYINNQNKLNFQLESIELKLLTY